MFIKMPTSENRTFEQVKEHYEIEKKLAKNLRLSSREERQYLYTYLYDQLFKKVIHHPQLTRKANPKASAKEVAQKMQLLFNFLNHDSIFLEVGPGDCNLAFEVAKHVKKVYAVDVSHEIVTHLKYPQNFKLIISDGCSIPVNANTVTVAYSNQLMEHLHPDDALNQLRNIYESLVTDGVYICITPNRLSGPHDISKYFDEVATGFHLKEYTHTELHNLFRMVGFSRVSAYAGGKGVYMQFPLFIIKIFERLLSGIPFSLRKRITALMPIKALLGAIVVARK